jgi:hypothetical protein
VFETTNQYFNMDYIIMVNIYIYIYKLLNNAAYKVITEIMIYGIIKIDGNNMDQYGS